MLTDKGFTHALMQEVLKDDPTNKSALKILATTPRNQLVTSDGTVYDADKVDVEEIMRSETNKFLSRVKQADKVETTKQSSVNQKVKNKYQIYMFERGFKQTFITTFDGESVLLDNEIVPSDLSREKYLLVESLVTAPTGISRYVYSFEEIGVI